MGNKKQPEKALTRDEYLVLADMSDRPLLDPAIGGAPHRIVKRSEDAAASRVFDTIEAPHENRTGKPVMDGTKGCGTSAGYSAHLRKGVSPCEACRVAYNLYRREGKR